MRLIITYEDREGLGQHLADALEKEALFIPLEASPSWEPLTEVQLCFYLEGSRERPVVTIHGELLQILDGNGLVFGFVDPEGAGEEIQALVQRADAISDGRGGVTGSHLPVLHVEVPREERRVDPGAGASREQGRGERSGITPLSWSIEQLRSNWTTLSPADKIRVARYGGRTVRRMIMKGMDKQLHGHLLSNPKITPDEVAAMASEAALDPLVLKRIASSSEWTQYNQVVKNLITNPKLPLPRVRQLLSKLSPRDMKRLQRSNRLRASVRDLLKKKLNKYTT